jgi:spermidine synthase
MRRYYFYGLNFLLGFVSLAVEIILARALAPYWGAGTLLWSLVVGFVLLVLALGYWRGGILADRFPDEKHLLFSLLPAALFLIPLALFSPDSGMALVFFAALAAVSLFFLGAGAPWVLRILLPDLEHIGETAGRLFAFATIGSFLGSLLAAILLLPFLGTSMSFLFLASLLLFYLAIRKPIFFPFFLLLLPSFFYTTRDNDAIFARESRDQLVRVFQDDNGLRLVLNNDDNTQSFYREGEYLTGDYWDAPLFLWRSSFAKAPEDVLILGNGAGTSARSLRHFYPDMRIDTVESDPVVNDVARDFFAFEEDEKLKLYKEDARSFIRSGDKKYNMIFLDVYDSSFIPFQFASKEFYQELRDDLKKDGLLLINVNNQGNRYLLRRLIFTARAVFPYAALFPIKNNSLLLLANKKLQETFPSPINGKEIRLREATGRGPAWSDDKSDIEILFPF